MNGPRARLVRAMATGSLLVPSVNTRLTRTIGLRTNPDPYDLDEPLVRHRTEQTHE